MNIETHLLYTVIARTQVPRTSVQNTPQSPLGNVSKIYAKLQGLSFEYITRTFVENVLLQPASRTIFHSVQCKYIQKRPKNTNFKQCSIGTTLIYKKSRCFQQRPVVRSQCSIESVTRSLDVFTKGTSLGVRIGRGVTNSLLLYFMNDSIQSLHVKNNKSIIH